MKHINLILATVISLISPVVCFANHYIQPTKGEGQEEILVQGASVLASNKQNSVLMYQTSEKLTKGKANFYFILENHSESPINFYFQNLQVTDQWGRPIQVVHRQKHLENKNSEKNWKLFASAVNTVVDSAEADKAGTVNYKSQTDSYSSTNVNVIGSDGWRRGQIFSGGHSSTRGKVECEALRRQAQREVWSDAQNRDHSIQTSYKRWEHGLSNYYFDSNTVFPNSSYAANFQIAVPKSLEKELEYLFFTYDVNGETHTFVYYCKNRR